MSYGLHPFRFPFSGLRTSHVIKVHNPASPGYNSYILTSDLGRRTSDNAYTEGWPSLAEGGGLENR
jgi:hypothetical protein